MSMYSKYRNDNCNPNRRDEMQRLNNRPLTIQEAEDFEQMTALEKWRVDHPDGRATQICVFLCMVIVGVCGTILFYSHWPATAKAAVKPIITQARCVTACHTPEVVVYKTLGQYRRAMKRKAEHPDKEILSELISEVR